MDMYEVISELVTAPGVTGNEDCAADVAEKYFRRFSDNVWRDCSGNVFARMGDKKPTIMLIAHIDEIGMAVTDVEENGMLHIRSVAGVDPRVLPGSNVVVHGRERIDGIVGAIPPHLILGGRDKAYKIGDMLCDTGLSGESVRKLVSVGDMITFALEAPLKLKNDSISGKSLDDRALVAVMIECMEMLSRRRLDCSVVMCASTQEEFSGPGAEVAAYSVAPDMALILDVTHAEMPKCDEFDAYKLDKPVICAGGNMHPKMTKLICDAASEAGIEYETEVAMGFSGTDADYVQMTRGGIPTGIISPPVKYMHTPVETIIIDTLKKCARIAVEFIASVHEDWEEKLCLDD